MRTRVTIKKWVRRLRPRFWYRRLRRSNTMTTTALAFVVAVIGMAIYQSMQPKIDPTAYTPLLTAIAQAESGGNYNAYYGNAANKTIRFTDMSVSDVLQWQKEYVSQGSVSSAAGRYQIIRPTLLKLVQELHIDPQTHFDEKLQDQMAIALLERRGSLEYVEKKITREQFAANLSKEWASLPKTTGPNPGESYYAADGINKSRVSINEIYNVLDQLKG